MPPPSNVDHGGSMASFAPLHTGQFIVKARTLPRRRAVVFGLIAAALLIPYFSFETGRMTSGYSIINSQREHFAQATRNDSLRNEMDQLQHQLRAAQLSRKVDQQASESMRQSMAGLQATIQKQQEELAFYKAIVTPAANASKEPQVQRLEIQADAVARRYRLRMTLIQPLQAAANVQGTLQLQVIGTRQGHAMTLPLAILAVGQATDALPFGFRYFQTLEQLIELPIEFEPLSLQIELHQGARAAQRQEFAWQPLSSNES